MQKEKKRYKTYVGPRKTYDLIGANQFNLLIKLGLREHHYLLDMGCGSLRAGKLFIVYLLPERYFGVDPHQWLIDDGIKYEIGQDILKVKCPTFSNEKNFIVSNFKIKFDYLIAHSIFTHTSPSQVKQCFSEVIQVMTASSNFVVTIYEGKKDYEGDSWVYPHCCRYQFETIKSWADSFGLSCRRLRYKHPRKQTWLLIKKA